MPTLTPVELQDARRRSGRLGGRPRKPTMDEARAVALDELLPKALAVLREHLESGRPDAWRPAVKVLEYGWGLPSNQVEAPIDLDEVLDLRTLSNAQLAELRNAVLRERPELVSIAKGRP